VFTSVFRQLQRGKALEAMTFLEGHYLLALDGTGVFFLQDHSLCLLSPQGPPERVDHLPLTQHEA
jgi:hypothetical protein